MRSALPIALVVAGCGPDFDRPSVVDSLRILAVRADPAAVAPGETTTLTVLVADPLGVARAVTYSWGACITFDGPMPDILLPSDCAATSEDLPIPGTPSADGSEITVTIPVEIEMLAKIEGLIGQSGTFGLPLRLVIEAGDERQIAIVPVSVVFEGEPNENPEFEALSEGGSPWPAGEPRTVREDPPLLLEASWPDDAAESYSYVARGTNEVVTTEEVLAVNWYSSAGTLEPDVTSDGFLATGLTLDPEEPPPVGADLRLWIVLSDGRGGVAWTERPLTTP